MNRSAATIALVPPVVVTLTSTGPAASCPAEVTVIWVLVTVSIIAGYAPKSTLEAPPNPLPLIVTEVPPALGPLVGLRPVTSLDSLLLIRVLLAFSALVVRRVCSGYSSSKKITGGKPCNILI